MIVTINRPEARNAVNLSVHMGIGQALEEAEADVDIRAIILTGAGDQAFCAGADLKALARGEPMRPEDPEHVAWGFAGYVSHAISKPTIAAVNGVALGGGTELTLASDMAIAADTATFGLPEVKRGIFAGAGGAFRLARQVAPKIAMEILLTGDPITAQRALELGLVNTVVPREQLLDKSLELANRIAANAPLSVRASKRIAVGIQDGRIASEADLWALSAAEGAALMQSDDAKEGPRAFAEKRVPRWSGR
jgi:crotonobetainyl-CoA hydratase